MARRILVVGGGYAGTLAAIRLARKTRAQDAEVVLADARPWFVERVRLHQDVAGKGPARTSLASMLAGTRVELRVGTVSELDLERRRARFDGGAIAAGQAREEAFDEVVLATGSRASRPDIPGIERTLSCATEEKALALRARLATLDGGRVVIVGAGLTGIELASELAEGRPDLHVTLVSSGVLAPIVSDGGREHVRRAFQRARVGVVEHARVVAVEQDAVVLSSGEVLPSDATVWCGGFVANPLGARAGLAVDGHGRAVVDARLRSTSHDFVRVAGDAARVEVCGRDGGPTALRMGCATAMPQGAFCADDLAASLVGRAVKPYSFAFVLECMSLGRRDGLVQRLDAYDVPLRSFVAGRPGAWIKELICRFAKGSARLERHGLGYAWPKAPALPPGAAGPMLATRQT